MTNTVHDDVLSSMLNVATKSDVVVVGSQTIAALVDEVRASRDLPAATARPLSWKTKRESISLDAALIRPLHAAKESPWS